MLSIFYITLRVFPFQDTSFIFMELRLAALPLKLLKGKAGFCFNIH